jgi:hypothetical protein
MSAVTILIARSARGQRSAEVGREPRFQSDARNRRFGRSARAGYPGGFDAHHDGRAGMIPPERLIAARPSHRARLNRRGQS